MFWLCALLIPPTPPRSPLHTPNPPLQPSHPPFCLKRSHRVVFVLVYMLGYGGIHWSVVDLPEAILLKRIDFPSPSNHQWLMVHLPAVGAAEPLVLHAGMLTGLSLYRSCIDNQSCCKPMSAVTLSYPRDAVVC